MSTGPIASPLDRLAQPRVSGAAIACRTVAILSLVAAVAVLGRHKMEHTEVNAHGAQEVATQKWTLTTRMLSNSVQRAEISNGARVLFYGEVCDLWQSDPAFAEFFNGALAASPFSSFFFETPAVNSASLANTPFELVTIDAGGFAAANPSAFSAQLSACNSGVTSFPNLGGDANLVVPCERGERASYGHIAAFVRQAPSSQRTEFWALVGKTLRQTLDARGPHYTWLSTEGSGVPWVHMRLDSQPKYYHHRPFRHAPTGK